jgi:hypothetical protein
MLTALMTIAMFMQAQDRDIFHAADLVPTSFQVIAGDVLDQFLLKITPAPLPDSAKCPPSDGATGSNICFHGNFNWKGIFDDNCEWVFRIDHRDYVISGADLINLVKEQEGKKRLQEKKP